MLLIKILYYQTLKETLFHEKLENGLEVYLLPKIGFEKTYGLFSTRFGSIDTTFVPLLTTSCSRINIEFTGKPRLVC